jgi:hypothetical protein
MVANGERTIARYRPVKQNAPSFPDSGSGSE